MGEGGDGIGDVWCGRRSRFVRRERPRRRGFVVDGGVVVVVVLLLLLLLLLE